MGPTTRGLSVLAAALRPAREGVILSSVCSGAGLALLIILPLEAVYLDPGGQRLCPMPPEQMLAYVESRGCVGETTCPQQPGAAC